MHICGGDSLNPEIDRKVLQRLKEHVKIKNNRPDEYMFMIGLVEKKLKGKILQN